MLISCLHVCLCTTYMQWLRRPEEGLDTLEVVLTSGCEPPSECWESKPHPLQEEQVDTEPSLQPLSLIGLRFSWRLSFVLGSLFYFILFLLVYYFNLSIEFSHFKLFFLFLNVYVCVWIYVCLRGCGSTCVWTPEADDRCLPPLLSTISTETGSLSEPTVCQFQLL